MTTRLMPLVLVVAMLVPGSGCAKPDWIQQTQVTVDVTGTWERVSGQPVTFVLKQQGPKVTGFFMATGYNLLGWRPVEGTVAGDVLSFRVQDGLWTGDLTVTGDEMSGRVRVTAGGNIGIALQRINSSSSLPPQP